MFTDKDYQDCQRQLKEAQQTETDNRDMVREADHFLNKKDGQWEPEIISKWSGKPRFTFDECNPIVDGVMGDIETSSFDIRVNPTGGESTKEVAQVYEGIIRNIENISGAKYVYYSCARITVGTGFSAWRVAHDYRHDLSFQQDLLIKQVPNAQDSVWFDVNAVNQDMSDAEHCFVLSSMSRPAFEKKFPKGVGVSVGSEIRNNVYSYKKSHEVIIGEYLYRKKVGFTRLLLLSNGLVVEEDEDFHAVKDELQRMGITVKDSRERPKYLVHQKKFDGADWLTDEAQTVFTHLPVVPLYGNFKVSENKVIYSGEIKKLMDSQRVTNYALSRMIEEGALSPKPKFWMTRQQATSPDVRRTLRTLNTNNDPAQFYDHVEGHPPPFFLGGAQPNTGLIELTASMRNYIQRSSGMFDEDRGNAPSQRSGYAIQLLQDKSNAPKRKWLNALEVALSHTARILVDAIPTIYDTPQSVRLINQDQTVDMATINTQVIDEQTGRLVTLNDLSAGQYDIHVTAGPAFQSKQQETVQAITEIAAIDPSIMQIGSDVLLNNINSPGIDQIAARKRQEMLKAGMIPEEQLKDEEKQMIQAMAQQPRQPDPMAIAAQAEMAKANVKGQEVALKGQIEAQKLYLRELELQAKEASDRNKQANDTIKNLNEQVKLQAETLKIIKDAMGAEAIVNPATLRAYEKQARELNQSINRYDSP